MLCVREIFNYLSSFVPSLARGDTIALRCLGHGLILYGLRVLSFYVYKSTLLFDNIPYFLASFAAEFQHAHRLVMGTIMIDQIKRVMIDHDLIEGTL